VLDLKKRDVDGGQRMEDDYVVRVRLGVVVVDRMAPSCGSVRRKAGDLK